MESVKVLDDWTQMWSTDFTPWHKAEVHKSLYNNIDRLTEGQTDLKILLPLCGKSLDMYYLASIGHKVVGVECSEIAVKDFFVENQLDYTKSTVSITSQDVSVYKSATPSVTIYVCDFFMFSVDIEGQFDAVWDRGSWTAIDPALRDQYCDLMLSLLHPNGRYMIETFYYDSSLYHNYPYSNTDEELFSHFNNGNINMDIISSYERNVPRPEMLEAGIKHMKSTLYLIKFHASPI